MTRLETIQEEIKTLSPEEVAELWRWLEESARPKSARESFEEIRNVLFPDGPPEPPLTLDELKRELEEGR